MTRFACIFSALLALGLSLPALAHDPEFAPDYSRSGLYVAGGGYMALTSSGADFPQAETTTWEPGPSLDFRVGWREHERLALEIDAGWVPSTDGSEYANWLLGVNTKFYFAEERLQPYLLLGAGAMWSRPPGAPASRVDWAFRHGIGVDYYLNHHWALSAETSFVWGAGELWKNYLLALNLAAVYRF